MQRKYFLCKGDAGAFHTSSRAAVLGSSPQGKVVTMTKMWIVDYKSWCSGNQPKPCYRCKTAQQLAHSLSPATKTPAHQLTHPPAPQFNTIAKKTKSKTKLKIV